MPGLLAIIGADANPLKRELQAVDKMAAKTGANIQHGIGGGKSTVMRETLVLLREISRGNWSRVPGSLSILLSQLGLLEGVTTAAVGTLGIFGSVLAEVGLAAGIVYLRIRSLTNSLTGLKLPDFRPEYIAKHLQSINQVAEGWKQIAKAVQEAKEKYGSVEAASDRAAKTAKEHFDFLRKINDLQTNPARRDAGAAEIDRQEKFAELQALNTKQYNLQREAEDKKRQADAIRVPSAKHDAELVSMFKARADAQAKELEDAAKEHDGFHWFTNTVGSKGQIEEQNALDEALAQKRRQAADSRRAYKDAVNNQAVNDEARKRKEQLTGESARSAAEAYTAGREIQDPSRAVTASEMAIYATAKVEADLHRRSLTLLEKLVTNTSPNQGVRTNDRLGGVHH